MDMVMFKIRHKETGLFSKGGSNSRDIWTKGGKTWSNIGHVKSHLNAFITNGNMDSDYPYYDAEIIKVFISYEDCFKSDVDLLMLSLLKDKAEALLTHAEQERVWEESKRRKLFEELQKEFG